MTGASAAAAGAAKSRSSSRRVQDPKSAAAYSVARDSEPESFEQWHAMLTASAKTEPSAPILSAIPPKSMRIFEGPMEKKALSSSGVKWQERYATLTDFHLGFAKRLDMKSPEAMRWLHTKKLPTSVSVLEEIFKRVDADGNGSLDLEEAKACLIELNLYSNDQDVLILFQALDVDRSETLSLEEFLDLTKKAHAANHVVDYIPLAEIIDLKAEIHPRKGVVLQSEKLEDSPSPEQTLMSSNTDAIETNHNPSFLKIVLNRLEAATGLDIDGDGKADTAVQVPGHDPSVSEVHICITTIYGGHNSGKTYIHRVPECDAQAWLEAMHVSSSSYDMHVSSSSYDMHVSSSSYDMHVSSSSYDTHVSSSSQGGSPD